MDKSDVAKPDQRYELLFPKTLSVFTRAHLWLRGYFDARRGKIRFIDEKNFASPYSRLLIERANYRINAEWQECGGAMFELKPMLVNRMKKRDEIRRNLSLLSAQKQQALTLAKAEHAGDKEVDEKLAKKSQLRRIALVDSEFDQRENFLKSQELEASSAVEEILSKYQDQRDIAETHERIIRTDFRARISVYVRGASKDIRIDAQQVNDEALDNTPRRANDRIFARYLTGEFLDGE